MGQRRLPRRRGDGPLPRLLVASRRNVVGRHPGRHRPVQRWYIADPADPATPPTEIAYPAAGTANPDVSLHLVALDGSVTDVDWDRTRYPYLADVQWTDDGLIVAVQTSRSDRAGGLRRRRGVGRHDITMARRGPGMGRVGGRRAATRPGRLARHVRRSRRRPPPARRRRAGHACRPPGARRGHRRRTGHRVPGQPDRRRHGAAGVAPIARRRARGADRRAGHPRRRRRRRHGGHPHGHADGAEGAVGDAGRRRAACRTRRSRRSERRRSCRSWASGASPPSCCSPTTTTGPRSPCSSIPTAARTPCVPSARTTRCSRRSGSPIKASPSSSPTAEARPDAARRGSGPSIATWPRPCLDDQVDALHAAAEVHGVLDLGRVAIRGWSFGGYLAALAVLRRPDVFHAAVAGAPVTDFRLYDTHYSERYLGDPNAQPDVYDASAVLPLAGRSAASAAPDPRPGRRQRRGRPHVAAVVGVAGGGRPARGAPARRHHAHDLAGGRGGAPAAPPARVPAPVAPPCRGLTTVPPDGGSAGPAVRGHRRARHRRP